MKTDYYREKMLADHRAKWGPAPFEEWIVPRSTWFPVVLQDRKSCPNWTYFKRQKSISFMIMILMAAMKIRGRKLEVVDKIRGYRSKGNQPSTSNA